MPKQTKQTKQTKKTKTPLTDSMEELYYKHYIEQSAKSGPNTAILLMVGKFFEMYDSVDLSSGISRANVRILAEICGCSVDPRPSNDPGKGRIFWGFPESSLPKFERILVSAGYTVVVIIQIKDATDTVIDRTIDHISSPGTFWDSEGGLAVRKDEQIMLSIYIEPSMAKTSKQQHWYIATTAFDVMTGKAISTEADITLIDGKPVLDSIQSFWSMYPPAEVVLYWCSPLPVPKESDIRSLFNSFGKRIPIHIQAVNEKEENSVGTDRIRLEFFKKIFKHSSAISIEEYLDIGFYHFVRRSLYYLLQFIKDHNMSFLSSLHSHRIWTPEENVLLGNAALEQLAVIASHSEKPNESLLYWLQKAITPMGKRTLRERCLKPIADIEELESRQERIAALRAEDRSVYENILQGSFDLSRIYRRFQLGNGSTILLLQMMQTYEKALQLINVTRGKMFEAEDSEELIVHIQSLLEPWDSDRIRASRDKNSTDAIAIVSHHPWKRGYHIELDSLEDTWLDLEKEMMNLKKQLEDSVNEPNIITWSLQDDVPFTFTTTARRATNIAIAAKRELKLDITSIKRGASTTVTLDCFALKVANEKAIKLRKEWKEKIDDQWRTDWSTWFTKEIESGMLDGLTEYLGRFDAECTFARISDLYGYARPKYTASTEQTVAGFEVKDLRHPIIERIHTDTSYVPHSLAFGSFAKSFDGATSPCGMLLYGVNAAGKSSLGKAIGLAVLMAQCGIPVPATEMTLIPYREIFTRILGNDNLWAGMSSFVVEMTEFRSILRSAGPRTLILGDELCKGTETASATAIVAAGIQTLTERKAHFFFATHLHELIDIAEVAENSNIVSYHLTVHSDVENGVLVYDRLLRKGCGSAMYGLEVCRGLDMDSNFLEKAIDIRKRYFCDDGKAKLSKYNAKLVVNLCEVCGSADGLETHHIIQQSDADKDNRISPGKNKNTKENLVVLCNGCHTKHHKGVLNIKGWVATTVGAKLLVDNS